VSEKEKDSRFEKLIDNLKNLATVSSDEEDSKRENANIDGNTSMGTMLEFGSIVSKELSKDRLIKHKFSQAHDNGTIHIHDLDFYAMGTTTCSQIDLGKLFKGGFNTGHGYLREPNDIRSYAALAAIAIQSNQNEEHGGQSIPAFDYYMAPGVLKTFKKCLRDNIEKYIEIEFDKEYEDALLQAKEILNKYGEIRSIEFTEDEQNKLKEIVKTFVDVKGTKLTKFALKRSLDETDKHTYQAMEAFIHNMNTLHSRAGSQVPFSSINFGTDTSPEGRMVTKNYLLSNYKGLGHGETPIFPISVFKIKKGINYYEEDKNYDLFRLACEVSAKRLFPNFVNIDASFNITYYVPGRPETEAVSMGCRTRVIGNINGESIVTGRGNNSFTSVNLPRLGIKHGICLGERDKTDLKGFYEELSEVIELVIEQLYERYLYQGGKRMRNFPFLVGQHIMRGTDDLGPDDELFEGLKNGSISCGFIGLAECLVALTGHHHGEGKEYQELGLEIIEFMRKKLDDATEKYHLNFTLLATPAEGLSGRFTRIDNKVYGEIKGVTDREYYTNSSHIPVHYKISVHDKIALEAPYHKYENAGHIGYVELDGDTTNNIEAFMNIIKFAVESDMGYFSVNHPVDRDPECGYTGVINDTCPYCGRNENQRLVYREGGKIQLKDITYKIPFDRIRRITGYLVGTVERFNDSKRAEERDRVKHSSIHVDKVK